MPEDKHILKADISTFEKPMKGVKKLLGDAAIAQGRLAKQTGEANGMMNRQKITMDRLLASGKKLVTTYQKQGAVYKVVKAQVKDLTAAQIKQLKVQQDASFVHDKAAQKAIKANKQQIISWQSLSRVILTYVIRRAFGAMLMKMREAIALTIEFNKYIVEIQTISQAAGRSFDTWAKSLHRVSNAWGLDLLDTANASYQALSNQISNTVAETEAFLVTAAKFSRITRTTLEDSVNLLTGILNAYGMSASRAEEVSAKLFKTIELGRVRGSELANSFGRVAIVAALLGVSLNELLASVATITIQSVKTSETMTLLRGIFLKLAKPTKDMSELFRELGASTAEQIIFGKGLVGTLEAIGEASEGTVTGIAKFLGRIRPTTGVAALVKDLDNFNSVLEEIKTKATLDYMTAELKIFSTSGEKLEKQLNELRNYFQVTFGRRTAQSILALTKHTGGLVGTINFLIETLTVLGVTAAIAFAVRPILNFFRTLNTGILISTNAIVASAAAVSALMTAGVSLMAIGLVGIFYGWAKASWDAKDKIAALQQELGKLDRAAMTYADNSVGFFIETFANLETLDKKLVDILLGVRAYTFAWEDQTEVTEKQIKAHEKLKVSTLKSIDTMQGALRKYYDEISKLASKTSSEIRKLEDKIREAGLSRREYQREALARYQTPKEQIKALEEEIRLSKSLGATNKELLDLTIKRHKLIVEMEDKAREASKRRAREQAKEYARRMKIPSRMVSRERDIPRKETTAEKQALVDVDKLFKAVKADLEAEKLIQEGILANTESIKETVEKLHKTVYEAREAEREAFGLEPSEYKPLEATVVDLETIIQDVAKGLEDFAKNVEIIKASDLRKTNNELLVKFNITMGDLIKATEASVKSNNELIKAINDTVEASKTNLQAMPRTLDTALDRFSAFLKDELRKTPTRDVPGYGQIPFTYDAITQQIIKEFRKELAGEKGFERELKGAGEIRLGETTEEFIARSTETLINAQKIHDQILENIKTVGEDYGVSIEVITSALRDYQNKINEFKAYVDEYMAAELESQRLADIAIGLTHFKENLIKTNQAILDIVSGLGNDTTKIENLGEVINTITNLQLKNVTSLTSISLILAALNNELAAKYQALITGKSQGGMIHAALGKPLGTDTVAAMLTPGEFIVNQFAAKRFFSRLVPMNYGLENPKFMGGDTTTVGDIHVTVNGGDSSNQTAVSIAQEIRREIRRGRIAI